MFEKSVRDVMQRQKFVTAKPHDSVSTAAQLMADRNVGAVLVVEGDILLGILTERDVVFRVVAQGRDAQSTLLPDVMTHAPYTVDPNDSFGYALTFMQEKGFRHLPVVENGALIGIISSRSAMDPELEDFVSEAQRRQHLRRRTEK